MDTDYSNNYNMSDPKSKLYKNSLFAIGWLVIILAACDALSWAGSIQTMHAIHDFGVIAAKATYKTMLTVPPFILVSACFLYASHRSEQGWMRRVYWLLLGVSLLIWLLTFRDFCIQPTRGWSIILGQKN